MSVVVACRSQMRWAARAFPREMQSVTVWEAIRGLFAPGFKTAANKAAIARLVELYRAGAQNADVYHTVYTIAMWGVAPIWRLWGAVVTIKRFGRKKLKRRPNNQSPVEEWMRLASVSLRTARYHIQKGIVETILAPAGTGKNRRLRRMILWKPSDKTQALLSIACCKRSSRIEMIS